LASDPNFADLAKGQTPPLLWIVVLIAVFQQNEIVKPGEVLFIVI
jgi:hypothetical protein